MSLTWRWKTLLCIIAMMIISFALWNPSSIMALSPALSARSTDSKGAKAFYLLTQRLKFSVKLIESPLSDLTGACSLLIILSPQKEISASEAEHLVKWLTSGGTIIMADTNQNVLYRKLGIIPYLAGNDSHPQEISPIPCSFTAGVGKVRIASNWRLKFNNSFSRIILLVDEHGTAAAVLTAGKGRLFVLSTPELFSNEMIGQADNSIFCINLAKAGSREISIDEFHHGFSAGKNIFTLLKLPIKLSLIQLLLITLLFFLMREKYYKAPQVEDKDELRRSVEYVRSIAHLLQRGDAGPFCLGLLLKNFRRELAIKTGTAGETSHSRLASLYAAKTGCDESALLALLVSCEEATKKKKGDPTNILKLAGELDVFRKGEGWMK